MTDLLLIHGRDQQGKNPTELKDVWLKALNEGLAKSNLILPESVNIVFPFYGDLLDSLWKEAKIPAAPGDPIARGDISYSETEFTFELVEEIAVNSNITQSEIEEYFDGTPLERGALNWSWVRAIMRALDNVGNIGSYSIEKFTFDVYLYLNSSKVQSIIYDAVTKELTGDKLIIVGHSLGSIIGYRIMEHIKTIKLVKYITVGSPLGLHAIRKKINPLYTPMLAGGWFNAFDNKDFVALKPLTKKNFNIDVDIVNKSGVKNKTKNHHGIEGYLDDKEVAKAIIDAIQNA